MSENPCTCYVKFLSGWNFFRLKLKSDSVELDLFEEFKNLICESRGEQTYRDFFVKIGGVKLCLF